MAALAALIVDEGKWLTVSLLAAVIAVAIALVRHAGSDVPHRRVVLAAMTLFFALTIGTMAFGHLLAVTTKLLLGTLEGSRMAFYAIGVALAVPSWWLLAHTRQLFAREEGSPRRTLLLTGWVVLTLLALGLHNLPLAAPGLLNIAYMQHSRRAVGWALVSLAIVVNMGLFVGSLVFLASGQTFEQFRGL